MNYADLKITDTTNGEGFGVSLFVSGCRHHCKGCFNSQTWDFNYGMPFTQNEIDVIIELLDRDYVDFFSILGGEPFEPENAPEVYNLVKIVRDKLPNIEINIWSGSVYEDLIKNDLNKSILELCDILVDGRFIESKRNLKLFLRGSENQRVIDLKKTFESGEVILSRFNSCLA